MTGDFAYEESSDLQPEEVLGGDPLGGSKGPGARFDTSIADEISTSPGEQRRRLDAISCGFNNDEVGARIFYHDPSPKVRAGALSALARLGVATPLDVATAIQDESPIVRRTVCELATSLPPGNFLELLADSDVRIIEACAFALGECEVKEATPALIRVATEHPEPLCRESAIAALGILGDELAREVLIGALDDIAQIRRRALIALSNFEGDDIDRAMRERLTDRDWQVRQAAEDLLGVNAEERR